MGVNHYDVLGVPATAELAEIRRAYRRLARLTHPDRGGDPEEFVAIALAWAVLSSPSSRADHDAELAGEDGDTWGEEIGLDVPAPVASPGAAPRSEPEDSPGDAPGPAPTDSPGTRPAPTPEDTQDSPPAQPGPQPGGPPPASPRASHAPAGGPSVDPFTSLPRALPPLDTSEVIRHYPRPVGGWAFYGFGICTFVAFGLMVAIPDQLPVTPATLTGVMAYAWILVAALVLRAISSNTAAGVLSATALYGLIAVFTLGGTSWATMEGVPDEVRAPHAVVVILGVLASVVLAVAVEYRRAQARRITRVLRRIADAAVGARRWNQLLHTLHQTPGATITRARVITPGRIRPEPGWAVVDGHGAALTAATDSELNAWCAALQAVGVNVASSTGSAAATDPDQHPRTTPAETDDNPEQVRADPQERLEQTAARLAAAGFTITPSVQLDGTTALMAHTSQFRWRWMAVRLHLQVYVQAVDTVTVDGLERFAVATMAHAMAAKGSMIGMQVGVATIPIQIGANVTDGARRFAEHQILRKYGAFAWPVAINATSGKVSRQTGRPAIGAVFTTWMRQQVDMITAVE